MAKIIIVSNRLPVSIKKSDDGFEVYPSAGGLATGLASYANKRGNLWIGWPGISSDDLSDKDRRQISRLLSAYNCQPVFLTQKQVDDFYSGYSNSLLWPFFHSMETDFAQEAKRWKAYREVNQLFRDAVLSLTSPGNTIWVHDYQLILLPQLLREHRPTDSIGFFLHIPFPDPEQFATLKQASALIRGLLGADLVGFHTKSYTDNFLAAASQLTSATPVKGGLSRRGRAIKVAEFPIGIDYVKFHDAVNARGIQKELRALQRKYRGLKVILTVDRLDPTKGFIERLEAYRTFLDKNPEFIGKVVMVMLAVPSRGEVEAYKVLKKDVEKLIREINKTYGMPGWRPISYIYENLPFEKVSALYQLADVAFITPIRDGMNLVAKEYVASLNGKKGMLILSQSAGAAEELKDALLVDHSRPATLVAALKQAIKMPPRELKARVDAMQDVISQNTIQNWAGNFMVSLHHPLPNVHTPMLTGVRRTNLVRNYTGALRRLLLFDYDGVLVPFARVPSEAAPSAEVINHLKRIAKMPRTTVAIVSGRASTDLERWLGELPVTLIAEHGALIRRKGKDWETLIDEPTDWKKILKPALDKRARDARGAFVEEKNYSLVWHYRTASAYAAQKNVAILRSALGPFLRQYRLKLYMGNKILEIKNPDVTKGKAAKLMLDKPYDFVLAMGDDFTDEDMFRALPKRAFSLKVGPGKTAARYRVKNTAEVQSLLSQL